MITMGLHCISYSFRDKEQYLERKNFPPVHLTIPLMEFPLEFYNGGMDQGPDYQKFLRIS